MKIPKMIYFDYGHTLVHETEISQIKGQHALMPYVSRNDKKYTAEDISAYADEIFLSLREARTLDLELHNHMFCRFLYEYLGLEFSISLQDAETIFWDNFAPGEAMPHADELLDFLNVNDIRTGVISNISFSGAALTKRLKNIYPQHSFERVIASSEYIFRKPNKRIFELAVSKAGLPPSEIWYCGDSPYFDMEGAAGAGIFPVWYCSEKPCYYRENTIQEEPSCKHIKINDWHVLIDILKKRLS